MCVLYGCTGSSALRKFIPYYYYLLIFVCLALPHSHTLQDEMRHFEELIRRQKQQEEKQRQQLSAGGMRTPLRAPQPLVLIDLTTAEAEAAAELGKQDERILQLSQELKQLNVEQGRKHAEASRK